ncbi:winged helix-turn-helix domain-containing protein [Kitasatospora sp. NPDC098663]|uniref:helix-turn-helix domain-containing protein n=1 Tax=Kitasatospora sp. NPDC098663 TaxID=3364096 RepID=UPI00380F088F
MRMGAGWPLRDGYAGSRCGCRRPSCSSKGSSRRKFHVSYSVSSYSVSGATRLMHRLGFSPQVPARRVAERNEEAVTVWKEVTRAEVKAPGRLAGPTSASRTRRASPADRPEDAPGAGEAAHRS